MYKIIRVETEETGIGTKQKLIDLYDRLEVLVNEAEANGLAPVGSVHTLDRQYPHGHLIILTQTVYGRGSGSTSKRSYNDKGELQYGDNLSNDQKLGIAEREGVPANQRQYAVDHNQDSALAINPDGSRKRNPDGSFVNRTEDGSVNPDGTINNADGSKKIETYENEEAKLKNVDGTTDLPLDKSKEQAWVNKKHGK